MNKHKLLIYIFGGFAIVKIILSVFFPECFILRHVWLLYSFYFLVVLFTLYELVPTVPLTDTIRKVECIMLGNGTLTNEVFDNNKYRGYSLLCTSDEGNAYSSNNGEMLYTKNVTVRTNQGDNTDLSLLLYIIFYSIIGYYVYELVVEMISGNVSMDIPIGALKEKLGCFNILSSKYPIVENAKYLWGVIWDLILKLFEMIQVGYKQIIG